MAEHGYLRCPSGEEPSPTFFDDIAAARVRSPDVVIDWGFPVARLSTVHGLMASGVEAWWFDGDRESALQVFLTREGHPGTKEDWDRELRGIDEEWLDVRAAFSGRILKVIEAGPVYMPNATRWKRILRRKRSR